MKEKDKRKRMSQSEQKNVPETSRETQLNFFQFKESSIVGIIQSIGTKMKECLEKYQKEKTSLTKQLQKITDEFNMLKESKTSDSIKESPELQKLIETQKEKIKELEYAVNKKTNEIDTITDNLGTILSLFE
jgi:predicted RNase H-like nuclease (RuvC/YqgF family)